MYSLCTIHRAHIILRTYTSVRAARRYMYLNNESITNSIYLDMSAQGRIQGELGTSPSARKGQIEEENIKKIK